MEKGTRTAIMAAGFAETRDEIAEMRTALATNLDATQYLHRTLDYRFDRLERVLLDVPADRIEIRS